MDVPGHFVAGGRTSEQIALEELIRPIVVVDISERAASEPATEVTEDDLRRFERRHGRIPKGALVAMNSGWAAKAADATRSSTACSSRASPAPRRSGCSRSAGSAASASTR